MWWVELQEMNLCKYSNVKWRLKHALLVAKHHKLECRYLPLEVESLEQVGLWVHFPWLSQVMVSLLSTKQSYVTWEPKLYNPLYLVLVENGIPPGSGQSPEKILNFFGGWHNDTMLVCEMPRTVDFHRFDQHWKSYMIDQKQLHQCTHLASVRTRWLQSTSTGKAIRSIPGTSSYFGLYQIKRNSDNGLLPSFWLVTLSGNLVDDFSVVLVTLHQELLNSPAPPHCKELQSPPSAHLGW